MYYSKSALSHTNLDVCLAYLSLHPLKVGTSMEVKDATSQ